MSTSTTSREVSASHQGGLPKLSAFKQALFDIVRVAQRCGAADLTSKEIQAKYESLTSKRVGDGNVAGRVSEMVRDGYLCRSKDRRKCVETRETAAAVSVPAVQAAMLY